MAERDVLTLGQASRIAECSRDTLRRAAQKEELRAEMRPGKKGQQWWIRQADLMDWLQARGKTVARPVTGEQRVQELEKKLAVYEQQAQQARQELARLKKELASAQQRAEQASAQLKTARGLVENWQGSRGPLSLRKLLGL